MALPTSQDSANEFNTASGPTQPPDLGGITEVLIDTTSDMSDAAQVKDSELDKETLEDEGSGD